MKETGPSLCFSGILYRAILYFVTKLLIASHWKKLNYSRVTLGGNLLTKPTWKKYLKLLYKTIKLTMCI